MKICVIGMGYVGISNAILLAQKHHVICIDIDAKKLNLIQNKISPIKDSLVSSYLKKKKLNIEVSNVIDSRLSSCKFIIISTPTNFDASKKSFDISSINKIIEKVDKLKIKASIVIKSTIPIGYVSKLNNKYKNLNIYFSPEFLREGHSLHDNLYPSRIIIGDKDKNSMMFAKTMKQCAKGKNIKTIFMKSIEAESVKLFANSYLATRISFFNELDNFSISNKLNSKILIDGVCSDPRISHGYNNPSFGFGGYCLPKDSSQLKHSFKNIPNPLIASIGNSNYSRKKIITEDILSLKTKRIGVYRIIMKKNSDNFRESSIIDIIKMLKRKNKEIYIYEPLIKNKNSLMGCKIINDLLDFKNKSDLIISNRMSIKLKDVLHKVYTRDVFGEN